jgi:RNA polymerase sigma factor (sigma-70 family)
LNFALRRDDDRFGENVRCRGSHHIPPTYVVGPVDACLDRESDQMNARPDPRLSGLMSQRRRLLNLAYRFLGSVTEAEDAVQETFARWYAMPAAQQDAIESLPAWLSTVISRVCLDQLGSARSQREKYVGDGLPEPVPDPAEAAGGDPADRITLNESIDMAFLVILESMSPAERVTFLLHDVFRYPFAEIAEIVGRTPAACRQLASAGRRRLRTERPAPTPVGRRTDVVRNFKEAWEAKDIGSLVGLLDPGAAVVADGGGLALASLHPIEGGDEVARYLVGLAELAGTLNLVERTVNGRPGLVAIDEGATAAVYAFEIAGDRIQRIWVVRNPDKLRLWAEGARFARAR